MDDATTDVRHERSGEGAGLLDGSPGAVERWAQARARESLDLGEGLEVVGVDDDVEGPCVALFVAGVLRVAARADLVLGELERAGAGEDLVEVVAFRFPPAMAAELAELTAELEAVATGLRPLLVRAWRMQRRLEALVSAGTDWPDFEALADRAGLPVGAFGCVLEEALGRPLEALNFSEAEPAARLLGVDVDELGEGVA